MSSEKLLWSFIAVLKVTAAAGYDLNYRDKTQLLLLPLSLNYISFISFISLVTGNVAGPIYPAEEGWRNNC